MDAVLLRKLPPPAAMMARLRALTLLDTIVAPDMRSFEWHPEWGEGEQMGAFKPGDGDFFFAWFCPAGAVVRGPGSGMGSPPRWPTRSTSRPSTSTR